MSTQFSLLLFDNKSSARKQRRTDNRVEKQLEKLTSACKLRGCDAALKKGLGCIVLAGFPDAVTLKRNCHAVAMLGYCAIVATDAVGDAPGMAKALSDLELEGFQLSPTAAILSLMKTSNPKLYAYQKADCTATICVLLDGGKSVLVINRGHEPFAGCAAFPGGFLRVSLETLRQAAARELREETGLRAKPGELQLVDERSSPKRDERGHVVDHGYVLVVSGKRQKELLKTLKAGDDAARVEIVATSRLLRKSMAFDHKDLLKAAVKLARKR